MPLPPVIVPSAYLLKYIHALITNKTIAITQRDESLIPVFLAMNSILCARLNLCERLARQNVPLS